MNNLIKRSPLFYVGDKYKLMSQLIYLFPKEINNYYEPFVGGGTVFLNIKANKYFLNDIDQNLIKIHDFLISSSKNPKKFFDDIEKVIYKNKLSFSYKEDLIPASLKKEFVKTYFAKFNKDNYQKLRAFFNEEGKNDPLILYVLLIYGFNRMLRFNKNGQFNLPVGNVDFNKNVVNSLNEYFNFVQKKEILTTSLDFEKFFSKIEYKKNDFVYFDPPYLIASSEYNKIWNNKMELKLLKLIDNLNQNNVNFALSNVTQYNDVKNDLLIKWMTKYKVDIIKSNYINYHNNGKKQIEEVLVTNF
jgi:DNA adenine methylase